VTGGLFEMESVRIVRIMKLQIWGVQYVRILYVINKRDGPKKEDVKNVRPTWHPQ